MVLTFVLRCVAGLPLRCCCAPWVMAAVQFRLAGVRLLVWFDRLANGRSGLALSRNSLLVGWFGRLPPSSFAALLLSTSVMFLATCEWYRPILLAGVRLLVWFDAIASGRFGLALWAQCLLA